MPLSLPECLDLFRDGEIDKLTKSKEGSRFLKLRSIARTELMEEIALAHKIKLPEKKKEYLTTLFSSKLTESDLVSFIEKKFLEDRKIRKEGEDELIAELYKVESFGWAGAIAGGLERTIVDTYVKRIRKFEALRESVKNDLMKNVETYVTSSWYNHWTSIIIEDLINDHARVLPAIGRIPKIDFFVDNYPFDLKVTFLPEEYISDYRKDNKLGVEKTLVKRTCRSLSIPTTDTDGVDLPTQVLWKQLADHPSKDAKKIIQELLDVRTSCLKEAMKSPERLALWLYENQGERRFDSSNRLFLILCDTNNFFDSWKLKRAKALIQDHLDNFMKRKNRVGFTLDFKWEGQKFSVFTDVIFVLK